MTNYEQSPKSAREVTIEGYEEIKAEVSGHANAAIVRLANMLRDRYPDDGDLLDQIAADCPEIKNYSTKSWFLSLLRMTWGQISKYRTLDSFLRVPGRMSRIGAMTFSESEDLEVEPEQLFADLPRERNKRFIGPALLTHVPMITRAGIGLDLPGLIVIRAGLVTTLVEPHGNARGWAQLHSVSHVERVWSEDARAKLGQLEEKNLESPWIAFAIEQWNARHPYNAGVPGQGKRF